MKSIMMKKTQLGQSTHNRLVRTETAGEDAIESRLKVYQSQQCDQDCHHDARKVQLLQVRLLKARIFRIADGGGNGRANLERE